MKIKDLIKKLEEFDPDQTVVCYSEDEGLRTDESEVQLFEISDISSVDAESSRLNDGHGKPWLKFGKSENSRKYVLIEIISNI